MNLPRDISGKHLKHLLGLIPKLESKTGPFAEHNSQSENGHVTIGPMDWSPELREMHEAIYKAGLVIDFDWDEWSSEAHKFINDPTLIADADFLTVRRLLTTHVRAERFCEGHLPAMCENGHIQAILERLKELWENGDKEVE